VNEISLILNKCEQKQVVELMHSISVAELILDIATIDRLALGFQAIANEASGEQLDKWIKNKMQVVSCQDFQSYQMARGKLKLFVKVSLFDHMIELIRNISLFKRPMDIVVDGGGGLLFDQCVCVLVIVRRSGVVYLWDSAVSNMVTRKWTTAIAMFEGISRDSVNANGSNERLDLGIDSLIHDRVKDHEVIA
jgi:hypothetical protein